MKKKPFVISIVCIIVVLCLVILRVQQKMKFTKNKYLVDTYSLLNDFNRRDSLLFLVSEDLSKLMPIIESRLDTMPFYNPHFLFTFIPDEACLTCISQIIDALSHFEEKYSIKPIIVCSKYHVRDLKIYLSEKKSKIVVHTIEDLEDFQILKQLEKNLLFLIYNRQKNIVIPYIESKSSDPLEFLKLNYYEAAN